jgi:UDP-2,3-diacylglucosamine hydrolase
MKPVLLCSDLHLSPAAPATVAAFHAFAAGPAREAAAVYVLGDLFDWWIGDDQLRARFYRRIADSLRALADSGVAVYVGRGNRDFLLGDAFARAAGATLLPDRLVVDLGGIPTLLSHGDELCTDDVAYQRFRARTRTVAWQQAILRKPYLVRRLIALALRLGSRRATAGKPEHIMDVNAQAVADAFRAHRVTRMIHGHTHRPARHALTLDGVACERHVLAAWHDGASYLAVDAGGVHERAIDAEGTRSSEAPEATAPPAAPVAPTRQRNT